MIKISRGHAKDARRTAAVQQRGEAKDTRCLTAVRDSKQNQRSATASCNNNGSSSHKPTPKNSPKEERLPHPPGFGKRTGPQLLRTVPFGSSSATTTGTTGGTTASSSRPPPTAGASGRRRSCGAGRRLLVGAGEVGTSYSRNLSAGTETGHKVHVFRGGGELR